MVWRALPPDTPGRIEGHGEVRDGDSLNIGHNRIRLVGIDAPELAQACGERGTAWACGNEAKRHLERLIAGRPVVCRYTRQDRFARYLASCTAGATDLNARMVEDGMAVDFDGGYRAEERTARAARRGLWRTRFLRPAVWRRQNPRNDRN